MEKQTFLMYKDWDLFISDLTDEQAGQLLKAIYDKQNGRDAAVNSDLSILFAYICKKIDDNEEKYRDICERRRTYGAMRKSKANEANASISKYKQANASISKQMQAKTTDTDTDTVTVTENDTGTVTGTGTDTGMDTDIDTVTDNKDHSTPEKDLDQVLADFAAPKFIKIGR